jgi:peptide/nickel transport system substrate-binding protein
MPQHSSIARRDLLFAGSGLLVTASVAGCSFFQTEAVQKDGPERKAAATDKESPMLAQRVKSGKLPAVEKRLPKNPMVVQPLEKSGVYGGTWRSAMVTQEDAQWLKNTLGYEPIVRWKQKWTGSPGTDEIMANLAEFEEKQGGKEFVFKLREGLKWSDGKPCTADDILFAFNDSYVYEEAHPDGVYELWTSVSGNPAKTTKLDERTVSFLFEEPKPGFLNELASNVALTMPKHYLQQFHKKYNPNIDELVKAEKLTDWLQLFAAKSDPWANKDLPSLNPWVLTTALGDGNAVTAERNPYYWKVDDQGRQLPYIDKYHCEILLDVEVEVLKIQNGELDMQMRNFATIRNKPVIARGREKGNYEIFDVGIEGVNNMVIGFNQTHPDANKRKLYANKDFRVGLSYAIDRQKIIDTIYGGQGVPWQCAPLPGSPVYDEEMGKQYTEYDPDRANQHLDKTGYTQRNGEGIRIGPGGKPISFPVLVSSDMADQVDALELVKGDWLKVGVKLNVQRVAETLYWERVEAGVADVATWTGGDFEVRATQGSNHYYIPSNPRGSSRWGNKWALWYRSDGKEGEEPPADVKQGLELFDEMRFTYDPRQATALAKQIIALVKERFVYIGICQPGATYGIVKNTFHNVPKSLPGDVGYQPPGPTNPEQYFISE